MRIYLVSVYFIRRVGEVEQLLPRCPEALMLGLVPSCLETSLTEWNLRLEFERFDVRNLRLRNLL